MLFDKKSSQIYTVFFFSKQNISTIKMSKKEIIDYFKQKIRAKHAKGIESALKLKDLMHN